MTCDDGIVKICDVVNVSEPGMKPKIRLRVRSEQFFGYETVGITRYFTALQAQVQIANVIHIWEDRSITSNNVCILEDGCQYRCSLVQHMVNEDNLPITKLSLERINEEYELEYKYLKAIIEGGLGIKPQNVLILSLIHI